MARPWILFCLLMLLSSGCLSSNEQDGDDFSEFDEDEEFVAVNPSDSNAANQASAQEKIQENAAKKSPVEDDFEEPTADAGDVQDENEDDDEASVENEADQDQFDPDEFEGFEEARSPPQRQAGNSPPPELKIAEVPMMLGRKWEHYYVEYLLAIGLAVYLIWYASGKTTNSKLANAWLDSHQELLQSHFALVGDDGTTKEVTGQETAEPVEESDQVKFIKEADHVFTLWCSGRTNVEGMVVTLRLKKRQDLINSVLCLFRPTSDQIVIRIYVDKDEMDSFVLCVGKKSATNKLQKEMAEIALLCPDRKSGDRFGLPSSMSIFSEISESVPALFDSKILAILSQYEQEMEYIFFSDQFVPKVDENAAQPVKRPDPQRILQFCFNLPKNTASPEEVMNHVYPLCCMALYFIDKVNRYRLPREAKLKAEKNRQKVQEDFLKSTHAQRQEAAQLRREEKRRAEKEKILSEEDPEKQRKWEERDYKRELKKRGPKTKALKIKS